MKYSKTYNPAPSQPTMLSNNTMSEVSGPNTSGRNLAYNKTVSKLSQPRMKYSAQNTNSNRAEMRIRDARTYQVDNAGGGGPTQTLTYANASAGNKPGEYLGPPQMGGGGNQSISSAGGNITDSGGSNNITNSNITDSSMLNGESLAQAVLNIEGSNNITNSNMLNGESLAQAVLNSGGSNNITNSNMLNGESLAQAVLNSGGPDLDGLGAWSGPESGPGSELPDDLGKEAAEEFLAALALESQQMKSDLFLDVRTSHLDQQIQDEGMEYDGSDDGTNAEGMQYLRWLHITGEEKSPTSYLKWHELGGRGMGLESNSETVEGKEYLRWLSIVGDQKNMDSYRKWLEIRVMVIAAPTLAEAVAAEEGAAGSGRDWMQHGAYFTEGFQMPPAMYTIEFKRLIKSLITSIIKDEPLPPSIINIIKEKVGGEGILMATQNKFNDNFSKDFPGQGAPFDIYTTKMSKLFTVLTTISTYAEFAPYMDMFNIFVTYISLHMTGEGDWVVEQFRQLLDSKYKNSIPITLAVQFIKKLDGVIDISTGVETSLNPTTCPEPVERPECETCAQPLTREDFPCEAPKTRADFPCEAPKTRADFPCEDCAPPLTRADFPCEDPKTRADFPCEDCAPPLTRADFPCASGVSPGNVEIDSTVLANLGGVLTDQGNGIDCSCDAEIASANAEKVAAVREARLDADKIWGLRLDKKDEIIKYGGGAAGVVIVILIIILLLKK